MVEKVGKRKLNRVSLSFGLNGAAASCLPTRADADRGKGGLREDRGKNRPGPMVTLSAKSLCTSTGPDPQMRRVSDRGASAASGCGLLSTSQGLPAASAVTWA